MLRPSGPVTGSSSDVVSSGRSSFTGTSSGTSALRVPPEGRTIVTGTSGMTYLLSEIGLTCCFRAKPVCKTRGVIYLMWILDFVLEVTGAGAELGAGAGDL